MLPIVSSLSIFKSTVFIYIIFGCFVIPVVGFVAFVFIVILVYRKSFIFIRFAYTVTPVRFMLLLVVNVILFISAGHLHLHLHHFLSPSGSHLHLLSPGLFHHLFHPVVMCISCITFWESIYITFLISCGHLHHFLRWRSFKPPVVHLQSRLAVPGVVFHLYIYRLFTCWLLLIPGGHLNRLFLPSSHLRPLFLSPGGHLHHLLAIYSPGWPYLAPVDSFIVPAILCGEPVAAFHKTCCSFM